MRELGETKVSGWETSIVAESKTFRTQAELCKKWGSQHIRIRSDMLVLDGSFLDQILSMSTNNQDQRGGFKWNRITIAVLLFLTFCFAGSFIGFRFGFQAGLSQRFDSRVDELFRQRDEMPFVKTYPIKDLMVTSFNLQDPSASKFTFEHMSPIIGDIERNVAPGNWEANGGKSNMQPYLQNLSLVISAPYSVHDQISAYLQGRRTAISHELQ